ncbi:uncharacterized protein LOC114850824 isoform X2 [Betta splendens]|uniref:Uncharacterized protein LOC114850824 isoform X2 n=1 Tax=Betta splendens TaxID=158456 RepID=A0A9W2XM31_BETSP|nr:uncharacterized protein LOC114850824 isoform X2 [Betta splendens]
MSFIDRIAKILREFFAFAHHGVFLVCLLDNEEPLYHHKAADTDRGQGFSISTDGFQVSSLEELGVETVVLSYDHQKATMKVSKVSSKGASNFLASTDTVNKFALHFKAASSSAICTIKEPVNVLVKRVQELFNQKYKDVGGVGRIPYQSLRNHNVTIHAAGLPKGLTLKKPSFYGRKQLEDIMKAEDQISFHIGGENGAQSQNKSWIQDGRLQNGHMVTTHLKKIAPSHILMCHKQDVNFTKHFHFIKVYPYKCPTL